MTSWPALTILKALWQWFSQPVWKARKIHWFSPRLSIMSLVCRGRPRNPALSSVSPSFAPLGPGPALPTPLNNDFFQEFMQIGIKKVWDQASLALPISVKARDDFDRPFKRRNPNFYYGHLHMECYFFYQQCENHFKIAGSQEYKRVPLAVGFLKDCILNWWQQYKTQM